MNTTELIKNYIESKHYKVLDDEDNHTIFRYQLSAMHAIADENDEHFCTVLYPNFDNVTEENMLDLVIRCNLLSADLKSVKAYVKDDYILAAVEFYYLDESDFNFQMQQALNTLVAARAKYHELSEEAA